jgi:hypothetical protein
MEEKMEMMKMMQERNSKFDEHDMQQRVKMGYFDSMSESERTNYDNKDKSMRTERMQNFDNMDQQMMQKMKSSEFSKMSGDDKKAMMGTYMYQMGSNSQ